MKFFAAIGLVIAAALSWQGVFVGITGAIAGFLPSVIDTPMVHGLIVAIISTLLCIGLIFLMFNYGKAKPSPASNGNGNGAAAGANAGANAGADDGANAGGQRWATKPAPMLARGQC